MSRRKDKAWQQLVDEHKLSDGQVDVAALAKRFDVETWTYADGSESSDADVLEEVKGAFYDPLGAQDDLPYVTVTLRCQRCDHRLDAFGVTANGWERDTPEFREGIGVHRHMLHFGSEPEEDAAQVLQLPASGEWRLNQPLIISATGNPLLGDGPLTYRCKCGKTDVQFARGRVIRELQAGLPSEPVWAGLGDAAYPVKPQTRRVTIAG